MGKSKKVGTGCWKCNGYAGLQSDGTMAPHYRYVVADRAKADPLAPAVPRRMVRCEGGNTRPRPVRRLIRSRGRIVAARWLGFGGLALVDFDLLRKAGRPRVRASKRLHDETSLRRLLAKELR